jgi:hypothetical protein
MKLVNLAGRVMMGLTTSLPWSAPSLPDLRASARDLERGAISPNVTRLLAMSPSRMGMSNPGLALVADPALLQAMKSALQHLVQSGASSNAIASGAMTASAGGSGRPRSTNAWFLAQHHEPQPLDPSPLVGGTPRGSVTFTDRMKIDGDGARSSYGDRAYNRHTSLQWHGRAANADEVPYVVLSPSKAREMGAQLGDLVRVQHGGRTVYAIYADNGRRLGEASIRTAQALNIPSSPVTGGVSGGVQYTVLPGSGAAIRDRASPPTFEEIQQAGRQAFGP